jgi:hypothetical protein
VRIAEVVRRPPPVPVPLDVSARRRGGSVLVAWRVAFAGRHVVFIVAGRRARAGDLLAFRTVRGGRAGRFHARLRARGIRWVRVIAQSRAGGPEHTVTARVA